MHKAAQSARGMYIPPSPGIGILQGNINPPHLPISLQPHGQQNKQIDWQVELKHTHWFIEHRDGHITLGLFIAIKIYIRVSTKKKMKYYYYYYYY
ncbi:hypothetical protein XELAEV_18016019mg [Xenopus laevis]|uniref:Uncharacterized protein n=1 Tax=Xenopus laevis TaxID=8355 RepID=A0A974GYH3_XENLA|nr:hypothetical protein XELAEV_18003652mg [Xenopus laevis]OCT92952.1 hypothetical protein XELAEV_18016019mg [Xenopus laevis]